MGTVPQRSQQFTSSLLEEGLRRCEDEVHSSGPFTPSVRTEPLRASVDSAGDSLATDLAVAQPAPPDWRINVECTAWRASRQLCPGEMQMSAEQLVGVLSSGSEAVKPSLEELFTKVQHSFPHGSHLWL